MILSLPDDYLHDLSSSSDVVIITVQSKKKSMFGFLPGLSLISEKIEHIFNGTNVERYSDFFKIKLE